MDYNLLAGKGRALNNKQNGGCKEDSKADIIIDDKVASASKCKPSNKAADKPNRDRNHDRNVFSDLMAEIMVPKMRNLRWWPWNAMK